MRRIRMSELKRSKPESKKPSEPKPQAAPICALQPIAFAF